MIRDDATWIHGKHMIQFGGMYIHNFNWHQRTDNGGGINYYPVYQLGTTAGAGMSMTGYIPAGFTGSKANYGRDYAAILGAVSVSQVAYTRSGNNLTLNPPLTPAYDKVTIPYWNFYGGDTWRMTSRFTLTYGLGWTLEMPPTEASGKQIAFVGPDGNRISTQQYLNARQQAALQGQVFNPQVGFALLSNVADHPSYIYNPYYGEWSPRVAGAWDINGDGRTVLRAGYGKTYGRLNGVDLVLVPLLGTGLIQPVQCFGALSNGTCGASSNPANVFRVGTDGLVAPLPKASTTLPQPFYPGVNGIAAGAGEGLDPNFRPNHVDTFTVSFARQINNYMSLEVGYIGRIIKNEYLPINLNAVPYMMTVGGQRFDKAYAGVAQSLGCLGPTVNCGAAVPSALLSDNKTANPAYAAYINSIATQPFFEASLSGTGYCVGKYPGVGGTAIPNCTAAMINNEGPAGTGNLTGQNVWSLYSDLDAGGFNFPRSMMNTPLAGTNGAQGQLTSGVGMNASVGYGNYNGLFVTFKTQSWKGITLQSNFTWSKALGTGAVVQATSAETAPDPFNLRNGYGLQTFDRTFVYNFFGVYQPNFYKSQSGFLGHVLGGWTIAPVFTAGSGLPITLGTVNGGGQAFGEGDSVNYFGYGNSENAIPLTRAMCYSNASAHYNVPGFGLDMFSNPAAAYNNIRQPILGYDQHDGGWGICRGLPYWNVDLSVKKQVNITERMNVQFQFVFVNLFNHMQPGDPSGDYLDTSSPASWGQLPGQINNPRQIQFGLRFQF
jgi:hypothetical protein